MTNGLKFQAVRAARRTSLSARTVEVRGMSGTINAISPKWSPGPRVRRSSPSTATVACPSRIRKKAPPPLPCPSRIRKKAAPPLPCVTISLPADISRSAMVWARPSSCLRPTWERNGTFWSASSVTDMGADATDQEALRPETRSAPSRTIRERGTTRSNPAASARSRTSGWVWANTPSSAGAVPTTSAGSTSMTSPTSTSGSSRTISCPPWRSTSSTRECSIRSGIRSATRATTDALLRADPPELLAHGLGPAPGLHDLGATGAHLAQRDLAVDAGVVEQRQRGVHGGRRRRVTEPVGHQDAPVPIVLRVGLGVAGDHEHRGRHVLVLVEDPHVELEVGPVVGQRIDDLLERVSQAHDLNSSRA